MTAVTPPDMASPAPKTDPTATPAHADPVRRARHHLLGAVALYALTPLAVGAVAEVPWGHPAVRETFYAYVPATLAQAALWWLGLRWITAAALASIALFVATQVALALVTPEHLTRGLFLKLAFALLLVQALRLARSAAAAPNRPTP